MQQKRHSFIPPLQISGGNHEDSPGLPSSGGLLHGQHGASSGQPGSQAEGFNGKPRARRTRRHTTLRAALCSPRPCPVGLLCVTLLSRPSFGLLSVFTAHLSPRAARRPVPLQRGGPQAGGQGRRRRQLLHERQVGRREEGHEGSHPIQVFRESARCDVDRAILMLFLGYLSLFVCLIAHGF